MGSAWPAGGQQKRAVGLGGMTLGGTWSNGITARTKRKAEGKPAGLTKKEPADGGCVIDAAAPRTDATYTRAHIHNSKKFTK